MAKLLYCIKMDLMSDKIVAELPKGTIFGGNQRELIHRFVIFIVYCYVPWWLTAPIPSSSPSNDLALINSLIAFSERDQVASQAALKCLKNHMWYLCEELVPLALFSAHTSEKTKEKIAAKLMDSEKENKRKGSGFGKPNFPPVPDTQVDELDKLVGGDSWTFF